MIQSKSGIPNLQNLMPNDLRWTEGIREIKCKINTVHWNHPETIPLPWSMENLSSIKPGPGAKKVGDYWSRCHILRIFPQSPVLSVP